MLGTSNYGAQLAAYLGIPYCYAYFITEGQGIEESIKNYKENFKTSRFLNKPKVNLCLWALASDDDEKAEYLFASRAYWKIARNYGELDTLKSPKDLMSSTSCIIEGLISILSFSRIIFEISVGFTDP